jgi:ribulose-phosphate 3-epimerase
MLEVLPSINCHYKDFECVKEKLSRVNHLGGFVHLDVADGKFTHNKSWNDSARWVELDTPAALEVHLMVEQPERRIGEWLAAGAKRIIVHYEAVCEPNYRVLATDPDETFRMMMGECEDAGCELILSTNPETAISRAGDYLGLFSSFQVLSVYPGLSGQNFLPLSLEKVSYLRAHFPDSRIEIDGGMNPDTIRLALRAGADAFVVGAYLFGAKDPLEAYHKLLDVTA